MNVLLPGLRRSSDGSTPSNSTTRHSSLRAFSVRLSQPHVARDRLGVAWLQAPLIQVAGMCNCDGRWQVVCYVPRNGAAQFEDGRDGSNGQDGAVEGRLPGHTIGLISSASIGH